MTSSLQCSHTPLCGQWLTAGPDAAAKLAGELGAAYPYVAEMALAVTHEGALGRCDDDVEFEFALDFILDGLDRLRGG